MRLTAVPSQSQTSSAEVETALALVYLADNLCLWKAQYMLLVNSHRRNAGVKIIQN